MELGHIFYSPLELFSSQMTPPRQRKTRGNRRERMILTGLHAEVWVATKEDSVSCVEVIDVLARVSTCINQNSIIISLRCVTNCNLVDANW